MPVGVEPPAVESAVVPMMLLRELFAVALVVDQLFADGTLSESDGVPLARLHELVLSVLDSVDFFDGSGPSLP